MNRNIALTLTMGAVALVLVGTRIVHQSNHHVTQVASSATSDDDTSKSGYIIASS